MQRRFTTAFTAAAPGELQRMRAMLCATTVEGFAGAAAGVRDLDPPHLLADIQIPVLVVAGAQDQATPPGLSQQLHGGICASKLVTLQAAHQSAFEQPSALAEAWSAFVAETA